MSKIHPSILNIDGERVEYEDEKKPQKVKSTDKYKSFKGKFNKRLDWETNQQGRHPSQLYISEDLIEMEGSKILHKIKNEKSL